MTKGSGFFSLPYSMLKLKNEALKFDFNKPMSCIDRVSIKEAALKIEYRLNSVLLLLI